MKADRPAASVTEGGESGIKDDGKMSRWRNKNPMAASFLTLRSMGKRMCQKKYNRSGRRQ
jgi:hypothetical protein